MTKSDFFTAFSGMIDALRGVIRSRDVACRVSTTRLRVEILLCVFLCAATLNAQIVDEWNISADDGVSNVTATLSGAPGDYTLTISGIGEMPNYTNENAQPWYPFRGSIAKVVIDEGVTSIGNYSFPYCSSLTDVTIPNSVITIGFGAFGVCTSLTEVIIPNNITSIGELAFVECTDLESVTFFGNNVTFIGEGAFRGCTGLTELIIPNSVTTIGFGAFRGCTDLESVIIGNSVTSIANHTFEGCIRLASLTIGNSVSSISSTAFEGCTGLTSIYVTADNANFSSENGVMFNKAKTTLIWYPAGKPETSYTIPNSVTSIEAEAFKGSTGLESVTIGNSVISIASTAFEGCTDLTSINVAADNTNYSSENGVLFDKAKTTLIQYPIGNQRESYTIPNSVTIIENSAFADCTGLTEVIIPNSVTTIGWCAFLGCTGLTEVIIPNSVTIIENRMFFGCTGLTSVTIGNSVASINYLAFYDCIGLTEIINHAITPQTIASDVFAYNMDLTKISLFVPAGSVAAYQAAVRWSDFNIVPLDLDIAITAHPSATTNVNAGSINGSFTVEASSTPSGAIFYYQWYSNTSASNTGGTAITGATDAIFNIPATLTEGTYFYFCEVSANGATSVRSAVATVNVSAATAKYTVTFNSLGGSIVAEQSVPLGGTVTQPANPTRPGFTFGGWYTESACINAWYFATDVVSDIMTLFAKWTPESVTSAEELFAYNLQIYPNPFTSAMLITGAEGCTLQIINAAGAIVHMQTIIGNDETISFEHLPAGVYIFRFENDGNVWTERVVKE